MDLAEQFNYLVDHGIIVIAEQTSKNLFEYNMFRQFKADLETVRDSQSDIEDLEERVEELEEENEELQDRLDRALDELELLK